MLCKCGTVAYHCCLGPPVTENTSLCAVATSTLVATEHPSTSLMWVEKDGTAG